LLFDPQTAGGLLAAIPKKHKQNCIDELKQLGYSHTCVLGEVEEDGGNVESIMINI